MLAERKTPDLTKLSYPMLGSPKLDGIRCLMRGGKAMSRKLKLIPNRYVQECLNGLPDGPDGELIVGRDTEARVWNDTQSGVMSRDGEPNFTYQIFDHAADPTLGFAQRFAKASAFVEDYAEAYPWLRVVPHHMLNSAAEVEALEEQYVSLGYEGLILRSLDGGYKYGRATMREGTLLKVKRFTDHEFICVDYVERFHNSNEQERDERGYAKRSHAKAGKVGTDTLGALIGRIGVRADGSLIPAGESISENEFVDFEIGTGYTDTERASLWARRDTDLIGSVHTFKFQGLTPDERKPRFPVWKGERHALDLGTLEREAV